MHVCEFSILYFYVDFSLVNSFCFYLHSIALHWTVVSRNCRLNCWLVSKQTKLQLTNVYRMLAKQPFFSDFQKQHDFIIAIFSIATTYFHSSTAKTFMFVFFLLLSNKKLKPFFNPAQLISTVKDPIMSSIFIDQLLLLRLYYFMNFKQRNPFFFQDKGTKLSHLCWGCFFLLDLHYRRLKRN